MVASYLCDVSLFLHFHLVHIFYWLQPITHTTTTHCPTTTTTTAEMMPTAVFPTTVMTTPDLTTTRPLQMRAALSGMASTCFLRSSLPEEDTTLLTLEPSNEGPILPNQKVSSPGPLSEAQRRFQETLPCSHPRLQLQQQPLLQQRPPLLLLKEKRP